MIVLKILHLLSQRPGFTGSGIYLRAIIELAAESGHQQAVISGNPYSEPAEFNKSMNITQFPVFFETDELPFPIPGMSDVMPYKSSRWKDLNDQKLNLYTNAFQKSLLQALDEFDPDLILCHHLWILTALARKTAPERPLYAIMHGTSLRQLDFCPQFTEYLQTWLPRLNLVFTLNQYQKDNIIENFRIPPEKIIISGNGYNDKIFYPLNSVKSNEIKLVYAGKLAFAKGLRELITALEAAAGSNNNFRLIICGSGTGKETEYIKRMASFCRYPIEFRGMVSQAELAEIFRNSDIFLLPSYFEGLPLVLIEALASGLQIIVNDLPGLKEWLGKDICNSECITFLKMPGLSGTDIPIPQEIPPYVRNLKNTILRKLNNGKMKSGVPLEFLKKHSWSEVYNRIKQHLPKRSTPIC